MSDKNNINKDNSYSNDKNSYVGFGVGFGLMGGTLFATVIGAVFGLIGDGFFPMVISLGAGYGMLLGIVIGVVMDYNKNRE